MFAWLKRRPIQKPTAARFDELFAATEGSGVERSCAAMAMLELEEDIIQRECLQLLPEDRKLFLMTYGCYVTWLLWQWLKTNLGQQQGDSIIAAVHRHFGRQPWHQPDIFGRIWEKMCVVMPMAFNPDPDGSIYPAAEMLMAPSLAGYSMNVVAGTDITFGIHVGLVIGKLRRFVECIAKEHLKRIC
jgi:hypothetical protein